MCSASGGRGEAYTGFWWGSLRERHQLGGPGVDGRVTLRWMFRKWNVGYGLNRAGSGREEVASTCECGNESSGYIKCGEF